MEKIEHPYVRKTAFSGVLDKNLRSLEKRLGISISIRGNSLIIDGPDKNIEFAKYYFDQLQILEDKGYSLKPNDYIVALDLIEEGRPHRLEQLFSAEPLTFSRKSVTPKTLNQQEYIQAMQKHDLVFGIGPAGTGKTYLAMALALSFLQDKSVSRIILTRPAIEAGERLGFLPGDISQKINPYLRPLYDALFDLSLQEPAKSLIDRGIIEIAPLAFMRGRTLNNAFIILDEAQNTTKEQMKMILTADITQIDLPHPQNSGVLHAMKILTGLKEIAFVHFNDKDVVRHPLVQKIVMAYQKSETKLQRHK